jgi:hypothetical protein
VFGFFLVSFLKRATIMKKKRVVVMVLMAGLLIGGFFGPPARGQVAGAVPLSMTTEEIEINWITPPPSMMCLGDQVSIAFTYIYETFTWSRGKPGLTPVANRPGASANLFASSNLGIVNPAKWRLAGAVGSGAIIANFRATQVGDNGEISLDSPDVSLAYSSADFSVVECNGDLNISASDHVDDDNAEIDSEFYAKGVISIDDNGVLTGEGDYQYILTVIYKPPQGMTCDELVQSTSTSSFNVSGTTSPTTASMDITFSPLEIQPVVVNCVDMSGKHITMPLIPGGTVDPNPELDIGTLSFDIGEPQVKFSFPYGKGEGVIYLVKRKGEGISNACFFQSC